MSGAKAIELCQQTSAASKKWGVLEAQYVRADGSAPWVMGPEVGIQSNFGPNVNVQGGKRMLVVSSGHARIPNQPDACGQNSCSVAGAGTPPPGFPQDGANCQGGMNINDDVALQVKLRTPTNATGNTRSGSARPSTISSSRSCRRRRWAPSTATSPSTA
jgi:hypothetical protein